MPLFVWSGKMNSFAGRAKVRSWQSPGNAGALPEADPCSVSTGSEEPGCTLVIKPGSAAPGITPPPPCYVSLLELSLSPPRFFVCCEQLKDSWQRDKVWICFPNPDLPTPQARGHWMEFLSLPNLARRPSFSCVRGYFHVCMRLHPCMILMLVRTFLRCRKRIFLSQIPA